MPRAALNKKLEQVWKDAFHRLSERRSNDTRRYAGKNKLGAYLTQDILKRRQEFTQNGKAALVLDYGNRGLKVEYTLSQLNRMAQALTRAQDQFGKRSKGVPVPDLIAASMPGDRRRARGISNAALYKFAGDTLFFRVTASGDTPTAPTHYQVRLKLEEWDSLVNKYTGKQYLVPAQQACAGRVSIDCNCGRHTYWYRYLATIGNFAVTPPKENVFPKIRNPKLRGACCKHVLKAMLTLQMPIVQQEVSRRMKAEAQAHGFDEDETEYLTKKRVDKLAEEGEFNARQAFIDFKKALKAFEQKKKSPLARKMIEELKAKTKKKAEEYDMRLKLAETVAKREISARKKDARIMHLGTMQTLQMIGQLNDKNLKNYAEKVGADFAVLKQLAKEEKLL